MDDSVEKATPTACLFLRGNELTRGGMTKRRRFAEYTLDIPYSVREPTREDNVDALCEIGLDPDITRPMPNRLTVPARQP